MKKRTKKSPPPSRAKAKRATVLPRLTPVLSKRRIRSEVDFDVLGQEEARGLGLEAGGQSGDTQGLSSSELADSESVEELVEEGQAFEAGVVSGVENAPDADKGPVRTRQVPEDDVPEEYLDQ